MDPKQDDPLLGTVIEHRYRVDARLRSGAMGIVYRAKNVRIDCDVAIKVLVGARDLVTTSRFVREARAAARVRNDHVVTIHDIGTLPDATPYIVMELLEGESLDQRLERLHTLDVHSAVQIVLQLLEGLDAAHATGAVHRDVKPGNVFLVRTSSGERVKLLDFGLSKSLHDARVTRPGEVVGTPHYLAPEQARGDTDQDARVDVWATGIMLYEMLVGEVPFVGKNFLEIVLKILSSPIPAPSTIRPRLPATIDEVVLRALEKDPERRYRSAQEMRAALLSLAADLPPEEDPMDDELLSDDDGPTLPVGDAHALSRIAKKTRGDRDPTTG